MGCCWQGVSLELSALDFTCIGRKSLEELEGLFGLEIKRRFLPSPTSAARSAQRSLLLLATTAEAALYPSR